MVFRELRRRLTPSWLRTDARRRGRDVLFRRLGIARCYTPPVLTRHPDLYVRSWLPFVVAHELLKNRDRTFMQVGAFDGVGDDDLRDLVKLHRLRGRAGRTAAGRIRPLAADVRRSVAGFASAGRDRRATRQTHAVGRRSKPTMAASFDRGHLLRHGIPEDDIVPLSVECHTVESALKAAGLDGVDVLQIDAEGYDWPIIRSIDFTRVRPAIVRFEYRNMPPRDADACLEFLAAHGYQFLLEPRDIIAHCATDGRAAARRALVA